MVDYAQMPGDILYKAGEGYVTDGTNGVRRAVISTAKKAGEDIVFGAVSDALTMVATDSGSASAKAAAGTVANANTLKTVAKILEGLAKNKGNYKNLLGQILSGNEDVKGIAGKASDLFGQAVNCVNGNGDMVGLSLDVAESGLDEFKKGKTQQQGGQDVASGAVAKASGQAPSNDGGQAVTSTPSVTPQVTETPQTAASQPEQVSQKTESEPERVYACDWGAAAKSSEEIENENEGIKEANKEVKADDTQVAVTDDKQKTEKADKNDDKKADGLNEQDKDLKDKLDKLKAKKKDALDKMKQESLSEDENRDEELQARVQSDADGVTDNDAHNLAGLKQEQALQDDINENNKKNKTEIANAEKLTNNAKKLATGAAASMLTAVASNTTAAALYSNPYTYAGGAAAAATASATNIAARAICQKASGVEDKSQGKQLGVLDLSKKTNEDIIPQFRELVNQRLARNDESNRIQLATRDYIESQKDGKTESSNPLSDLLNGLNAEENKLVAQREQNQNNIIDFNNNSTASNNGGSVSTAQFKEIIA